MHDSIIVNRQDLARGVAFASLGLARRPVLPVLGGLKVTFGPDRVTFAAYDYETAAAATVAGDGGGNGTVLVDGRDLATAIKAMPKARDARLGLDGDSLILECDGTMTVLAGMDSTEYPAAPDMPELSATMDAEAFARSVARVSAAAGTDDTLPVLLCVHLAGSDGRLTLAATDRYRLAVDYLGYAGQDLAGTLIPAKMLAAFAKAAAKSDKVTLHLADGKAGLSDGTRSLVITPNRGEYVRYGALIRSEHDAVILADAKALAAAVAWAGKLAGKGEPIRFDAEGGRITVTATADGAEKGKRSVPCTGDDVTALFTAEYLASMLAGYAGTVRIGFKTSVSTDFKGREIRRQGPVQIEADGDEFLTLVCPHRPRES